ncbi:MAG: hypothetical protein UY39_C0019G0002 [Candidatus Kaiserbacteria bacterium GW2011_GWC2_49_12]|uniref:Homeodomain phBC6A51-type domain-containing protein n=3 Tax=Parcubacteria group TaxID=1794811 RepID=A0A0G1PFR2_9BACT|nr:MAG: hypothetical protein UX06_C0024G0002 [Candidatus Giovannonibacteria bacterium GW2011_GWA2_45_21]KKW07140.1 MAG: hypothetical protein UY39_C0019G0002 [Candidatus Kaiserbacteria bacterium GW2011_GWC2_49_12]OGG87884.1 MAG: hypothetical protein A3H15_00390 [Candidatus Kaiserbacteria bacterium RIFCSPLOWO2_12_FULL_50_28]
MIEDRLRPKNPPVLPQPTVPVVIPQSELRPTRRVAKKHVKNTRKNEKGRKKKRSDFSDFEEKPKLFRLLDASRVHNPLILLEFVRWNVVPQNARAEFNLPVLHTDFAKKYGVSTDTLTNWKRLPFFWDEVALHRNNDFRRFTSDVYYGLTKRAMTGDPRAVELFAKLFEGFSDKIRVEDETPPKELLPDEIAKVKHALYNIGLKAVIKANEPENPDEYEQAALG